MVLLPNINPDKYQKPLENLRQTVKSIPFRFRDARVEITISIGATLFAKATIPRTSSSAPTRRSTAPKLRAGISQSRLNPDLTAAKNRQNALFPYSPAPPLPLLSNRGCQGIPFSPRESTTITSE